MSKCMLSLREAYLKWRCIWICLYISLREYIYCVHGLLAVMICTYVYTTICYSALIGIMQNFKTNLCNSITTSQSKTVKFKYSLTIILIQLVLSCQIVTITISFKYISALCLQKRDHYRHANRIAEQNLRLDSFLVSSFLTND